MCILQQLVKDFSVYFYANASDGSQWAHLSCSLWIPEIAIVDTEKMEPIDKISEIPVPFCVSFVRMMAFGSVCDGSI